MFMNTMTDSTESLGENKGKMSLASGSSQSSSSSSSLETKFQRLNLKLRSTIRKSWSFRKMEEYSKRGRSQSDLGFYDPRLNANGDQKPQIPLENITRVLAAHSLRLARPAANIKEDLWPRANPLLVEDPPSASDDSSNDEDDHAHNLLIGSTNNCPATAVGGGAGAGARSAPATPLQPPTPTPLPQQRTPEHRDKNGKQPSWSANEVSGGSSPPPPSGSKARQKKFHRHFPQAAQEERVLNYYSCALVGDILLQGHLYITKNYFAFYSNVFGYVTKLLIPLASVIRVTKEKMARIIPNAVGVATLDDKHVFASLLSRDTTYKLMTEVWKASRVPIAESIPIPKELRLSKVDVEASEVSVDDESSICSQSGGEDVNTVAEAALSPSPEIKLPPVEHEEGIRIRTIHTNDTENVANNICGTLAPRSRAPLSPTNNVMSRRKVRPTKSETSCHYMLIAAVGFSILLIVSASLLFYKLQGKAVSDTLEENLLLLKRGDDVYSEILKWHSQLHSKSAMQVHEFLHSNLDQISKVRQSLETLSTLIGGIITDKMKSPMDSNQGFITRSPEDEAGFRDNPGSGRPSSDGES